MRASAWRFGLSVVGVLALAVMPAHAVIVYADPGRLTTMPTLSGSVKPGWQYIGTYGSFTGIPIGPRAWVTATHVSGATGTIRYDNAGTTVATDYASTRVATSGDLAVFQLDAAQPDFKEWAPVWNDTTTLVDRVVEGSLDVYMYGRGTNRGSPIDNGNSQPGGWNWASWTGSDPLSYGTGNVFDIVNDSGNDYLQMPFFPNESVPTSEDTNGIFSTGDSGGAIFAFDDVDSRWELIGVNYAVDTVFTAPTSNLNAYLSAAFYDARGMYYYTRDGNPPVTNWHLIEAPVPVVLSSYSTALPQKYSVLAPFIPVPEPSTLILGGLATGGMIVAARRKRRLV